MTRGYQEFTTREYVCHYMSGILTAMNNRIGHRSKLLIDLNKLCIKCWLPGWIRYCDKYNLQEYY